MIDEIQQAASMWKGIKGMFASKKFLITMVGTIIVAVMFHMQVSPELIQYVAGLFGVGIASQGLADMGKEKARIEATKEKMKVELDVKTKQGVDRIMS